MNTRAKAVTVEELNLTEMENVNGAGVAEFFEELLECILDGMTNAD